eukprot:m.103487 g.103487  ORF g.103487 m.103487 type:complete len:195 (+) comp27502_c0_seq3:334-918(+)
MAATTNVGELLKQRDTSGDVVADVHNVIQCLTDHSMAVVRIHKPEIAAQVTQLLFKVAKQMATKSELHILLVTPSSAWLDACVTDMNVADVTGLSKLEIKYCQSYTDLHVLLASLQLAPNVFGTVIIDNIDSYAQEEGADEDVCFTKTLAFAVHSCTLPKRNLVMAAAASSPLRQKMLTKYQSLYASYVSTMDT